jgi:hypothetical protein
MRGYSGEVRRATPDEAARGGGLQWLGVLLPPIAMLTNVSLGYAFVPWSCSAQSRTVLHIEIAALVIISIAAGFVAHREWRQFGGGGQSDDAGGPGPRARFLGLMGIGSSILFTLILLAQWFANVYLTPCNGT